MESPTTLSPGLRSTVGRCKERLERHYGARLEGVLLYGSAARHDATPESDIDLLVLLRGPFEHFRELEAIVDLLYDLQLEADQYISARPARVQDFEAGRIQLYRNAREEGIRV